MSFYTFAKAVLTVLLRIKGYQLKGIENIPAEGPLIVAANHLSLWDPIIVGCTLPRKVLFMAKEELFEIPVLGKMFEKLGAFPVKRGQGDIRAIRKALMVLKEGRVLGIFPEGTRSKGGDMQEALAGIGLIMDKSKAPILPIKIYGTKGLLKQKKGNIRIVIGQPIYAEQLKPPPEAENRRTWLTNEIMNKVSEIK